MLIEDGEILPAAFSLSVFNTPPALASMALNLTAGYSAVYPGKNNFLDALLGAVALLKTVTLPAMLALVYADEQPVEEYRRLQQYRTLDNEEKAGCLSDLAFAVLLSTVPEGPAGFPLADIPAADCKSPRCFLAALERQSRTVNERQNGTVHG
jgi:hypothetical protein